MKMKKKVKALGLGIILVVALCLQACKAPTEEIPKSTPTPEISVENPATETPAPTETPTATEAPVPTETPAPVATKTPTEAPAATMAPVATKAPEAPSELTVDLSGRLSVWGQGTGVENADGSVTFAGGTVDKCSFPLPVTLKAGEKLDVVATLKFDSTEDVAVRFYLTDDSFSEFSVFTQ